MNHTIAPEKSTESDWPSRPSLEKIELYYCTINDQTANYRWIIP